tara:strand:+ start:495 stop:992 length:498 start_codon:yes stop_codon:yes gene_type:complete
MFVFDLDQTIVDSSHRTPLKNGRVDIPAYVRLQTPKNIDKDSILPLADKMRREFKRSFIVVCTARKMTDYDYLFLKRNNLFFDEIYERGNVPSHISKLQDAEYKSACLHKYKDINYTFYDDSKEVIKKFKNFDNVKMVDSVSLNKRLLRRRKKPSSSLKKHTKAT